MKLRLDDLFLRSLPAIDRKAAYAEARFGNGVVSAGSLVNDVWIEVNKRPRLAELRTTHFHAIALRMVDWVRIRKYRAAKCRGLAGRVSDSQLRDEAAPTAIDQHLELERAMAVLRGELRKDRPRGLPDGEESRAEKVLRGHFEQSLSAAELSRELGYRKTIERDIRSLKTRLALLVARGRPRGR